jgi:hypothetical protein
MNPFMLLAFPPYIPSSVDEARLEIIKRRSILMPLLLAVVLINILVESLLMQHSPENSRNATRVLNLIFPCVCAWYIIRLGRIRCAKCQQSITGEGLTSLKTGQGLLSGDLTCRSCGYIYEIKR